MGKDVVGIAGCGAMGLPMAQRLADAGYEVWGHDVRPAAEFGGFASRMVADAAGFSSRCNIVISVVRDAAQTRALLFLKIDQPLLAARLPGAGSIPGTFLLE